MATTFSGTLRVIFDALLQDALDLSTPKDDLDIREVLTLTNGTGANKGEYLWHDRRTLATTANETLDLNASLSEAVGGGTFDAALLVAWYMKNRAITAGEDLEIGGAAATAFEAWVKAAGDVLVLRAGGWFLLTAPIDGYTVGAAASDSLKITNDGAGSIDYDIALVGRSA